MFGFDKRALNEMSEEERLKILYAFGLISAKDANIEIVCSKNLYIQK